MTTKKMTLSQALAKSRAYVAERKEIRSLLIAEGRRLTNANPKLVTAEGFFIQEAKQYNSVRKLNHYPSDLSDERILALIDECRAEGIK